MPSAHSVSLCLKALLAFLYLRGSTSHFLKGSDAHLNHEEPGLTSTWDFWNQSLYLVTHIQYCDTAYVLRRLHNELSRKFKLSRKERNDGLAPSPDGALDTQFIQLPLNNYCPLPAPSVLRELDSVGDRTMVVFQGCPQPDVLRPTNTLLFIMTVFGRYG